MSEIVTFFGNVTQPNASGIKAPNGFIYFIPFSATQVWKLDPSTDTISTFGSFTNTGGFWASGVLVGTDIYCIPFNTDEILKIDTTNDTVSLFDDGGLPGITTPDGEWSGAVLAQNGSIYCIPYNNQFVLIIDPSTDTISSFDSGIVADEKWSGGALILEGILEGRIFSAPRNHTNVAIIDTNTNSFTLIGATFPRGNASQEGKWVGSRLGSDGWVYFIPFNRESILRVNPSNLQMQEIGNFPGNQKWIGSAITDSGIIYAAPSHANYILKIDTVNDSFNLFHFTTVGEFKWSGGVYDSDENSVYITPSGNPQVLKISFASDPSSIVVDLDVTNLGKKRINKDRGEPIKNSYGRLYIAPYQKDYDYYSFMLLTSITKGMDSPTPIFNSKYEQIGSFRELNKQYSSTLSGRIPLNTTSTLEELSELKCSFDLQLHLGRCTNPNNMNEFEKAIIFENVEVTGYSTEDMITFDPNSISVVNETVDISMSNIHYVNNINYFTSSAPINNENGFYPSHGNILGICDNSNCYNCDEECQNIFILERIPTSDFRIIYSGDKGETWKSEIIPNSEPIANQDFSLTCCNGYVYVLIPDPNIANHAALYRRNINDLFNNLSQWQKLITTNFPFSNIGKIACVNNKIYAINYFPFAFEHASFSYDIKTGIIETNTITPILDSPAFNDVYVYSEQIFGAVVVDEPILVITFDGGKSWRFFTYSTDLNFSGNLVIIEPNKWLITNQTRQSVYYTDDGGRTWEERSLGLSPLSISFANRFIGYISGNQGRILRTIDGGRTWKLIETEFTSEIRKVISCKDDLNFTYAYVADRSFIQSELRRVL